MGEVEELCVCGHRKGGHSSYWCYGDPCICGGFRAKTDNDEDVNKQDEVVSPSGGKRQRLNLRFDHIPGGFTSLSWIARVAEYGNVKKDLHGDYDNWKKCDPHSEQSPLNHAIGHALEACELKYGSLERIWALAKAAWNLLAQIWFEVGQDIDAGVIDEWFEMKCAPKTCAAPTKEEIQTQQARPKRLICRLCGHLVSDHRWSLTKAYMECSKCLCNLYDLMLQTRAEWKST